MIDINAFVNTFKANYNGLYNGTIHPKKDYVALGDKLINAHDPLVSAFNEARQDILIFDREVAAFAMTYEQYIRVIE